MAWLPCCREDRNGQCALHDPVITSGCLIDLPSRPMAGTHAVPEAEGSDYDLGWQ